MVNRLAAGLYDRQTAGCLLSPTAAYAFTFHDCQMPLQGQILSNTDYSSCNNQLF